LYFLYQLVCNLRPQDNRVYVLKQWEVWECFLGKTTLLQHWSYLGFKWSV
jgi:hypothetical protein